MIEKIAAAWDIKCIEAYHFDGVKALDPEAGMIYVHTMIINPKKWGLLRESNNFIGIFFV